MRRGAAKASLRRPEFRRQCVEAGGVEAGGAKSPPERARPLPPSPTKADVLPYRLSIRMIAGSNVAG